MRVFFTADPLFDARSGPAYSETGSVISSNKVRCRVACLPAIQKLRRMALAGSSTFSSHRREQRLLYTTVYHGSPGQLSVLISKLLNRNDKGARWTRAPANGGAG